MGLFSFFRTPEAFGVGTGNLALAKPQTNPIQSIYGPRYNVRGFMTATRPAYMKYTQSVPIVPIEGNGAYIQGTMALQALTDLENEKAKAAAK